MTRAYIGLGSNLENPTHQLQIALENLKQHPALNLLKVSSFYETEPYGVTDQPDFINAVAEIETGLSPHQLLHVLLDLEQQQGRVRTQRWGPRIIDLDLLLYGDLIFSDAELTLPHPEMHLRDFVMKPLLEIAPDLVLPNKHLLNQP